VQADIKTFIPTKSRPSADMDVKNCPAGMKISSYTVRLVTRPIHRQMLSNI
jgi:hypothetical protein